MSKNSLSEAMSTYSFSMVRFVVKKFLNKNKVDQMSVDVISSHVCFLLLRMI